LKARETRGASEVGVRVWGGSLGDSTERAWAGASLGVGRYRQTPSRTCWTDLLARAEPTKTGVNLSEIVERRMAAYGGECEY
jgi:hypothetical protein